MNQETTRPPSDFPDPDDIELDIATAVREALLRHKKLGNPVVVWRDGKVVWIPPDEIDVEAPEDSRDLITESKEKLISRGAGTLTLCNRPPRRPA